MLNHTAMALTSVGFQASRSGQYPTSEPTKELFKSGKSQSIVQYKITTIKTCKMIMDGAGDMGRLH